MVTNIDGFNSNNMEGFEFKASITQEVKLNPIHHKSQFFTVVPVPWSSKFGSSNWVLAIACKNFLDQALL